MQKDTWTIIGVMVTLVGLQATFMVTSLASIESRLTAMENHFSERLAAMDGRLHDMNTRLSRIEGHLGLPAEVEPIQFETIGLNLPSPAINLHATQSVDTTRTKTQAEPMSAEKPTTPMPGRHARLFRNGRNQAVRIPRQFELAADEVIIFEEDGRLVLEPVARSLSLGEVLSQLAPSDEEFPSIADSPVELGEVF